MTDRTLKKSAHIAAESSYGVDPDADGSDYAWIPAYSIGEVPAGTTQLETNYMTNRGMPTASIAGPDGGQVEIVVPPIGLPTEAGDGVSASAGADDWYDDFWENHVSDTPLEKNGEGIASANTTDITFDAVPTNISSQSLIAVYDGTGFPSRSQWTQVQSGSGAGPYTVEPDFDTAPTAAGITYGSRAYRWMPTSLSGAGLPTGGSSRAIYIQDDQIGGYSCLGGRIVQRTITGEAGGRWEDRCTWAFDSITEDSSAKSSLSQIASPAPAVTPLIITLSPVWFGGTAYVTRRIEINFNIEAAPVSATSGANGRSGYDILACNPTVVIETDATDAIRNLHRGPTSGQLLVQLGGGVFGTVLNTCCFFAHRAQVMEAARVDDSGRARHRITFKVIDEGAFASTNMSVVWAFARA